MEQPVDQILVRRAHAGARRPWLGVAVSLTLHVALVVGFVVAPALAAKRREPIEYIAIQVVPVAALGVPEPKPAPPRAPEPAPQEPEPEPEPEPQPAEPEPKPEPRRAPPEEPRRRQPSREPEPRPTAPAAPQEPAERKGTPGGSATGTSAFGTAIAGLDNPDFVYNYYVEQMLSLIGAQWVRPPVGGGVEAKLYFRIGRDGRISDLEIVESSGHSSFDLAGLRAVQLADPLPPLPNSYAEDSLGVNLVIR